MLFLFFLISAVRDMIGNNETISSFKGTGEISKLLLKRMKLTQNWVWKEKVQDNSGNSNIEEREVDENIIKRMKVNLTFCMI